MASWDDSHLEHDDVRDFIAEVQPMLDGVAAGVTRQYLARGYVSLSSAQRAVLTGQVLDVYATEECSRCHNAVPWSEQLTAYDNGRLCGYCEHMTNKDD